MAGMGLPPSRSPSKSRARLLLCRLCQIASRPDTAHTWASLPTLGILIYLSRASDIITARLLDIFPSCKSLRRVDFTGPFVTESSMFYLGLHPTPVCRSISPTRLRRRRRLRLRLFSFPWTASQGFTILKVSGSTSSLLVMLQHIVLATSPTCISTLPIMVSRQGTTYYPTFPAALV